MKHTPGSGTGVFVLGFALFIVLTELSREFSRVIFARTLTVGWRALVMVVAALVELAGPSTWFKK